MNYYFTKTLLGDFSNIIERVTESLKAEGFEVLTEIEIKATLKKKLENNFYK